MFIFVLGKTAKSSKTQTNRDCILIDEVDGMAGNEDRGGIQVGDLGGGLGIQAGGKMGGFYIFFF